MSLYINTKQNKIKYISTNEKYISHCVIDLPDVPPVIIESYSLRKIKAKYIQCLCSFIQMQIDKAIDEQQKIVILLPLVKFLLTVHRYSYPDASLVDQSLRGSSS